LLRFGCFAGNGVVAAGKEEKRGESHFCPPCFWFDFTAARASAGGA
jgi:hypothetical protein